MGECSMNWHPVTATMLQTDCKTYQISRSGLNSGKFTYRAWFRPENKILATVGCYDESGDRAAALTECKQACEVYNGAL